MGKGDNQLAEIRPLLGFFLPAIQQYGIATNRMKSIELQLGHAIDIVITSAALQYDVSNVKIDLADWLSPPITTIH